MRLIPTSDCVRIRVMAAPKSPCERSRVALLETGKDSSGGRSGAGPDLRDGEVRFSAR